MFESISKAINRRKILWSKESIDSNQRVFNEWQKVIFKEYGPEMITLIRPYSFKNSKLIVFARNPLIACEVQAKKDRIRNTINKNIGSNWIKEIILRVR